MSDLSKFKFKQTFRVHFDECDPAGVVHNSSYIKYFERSRIAYFRELGLGWNVEDLGSDYYVVVGENYCRYQAPARFDDELTVYVRFTELKRATVKAEYIYRRESDDTTICKGHAILVKTTPDYKKAAAFNGKLRETVLKFEGNQIEV
jgi:acyl-CoA thioester hydrolase